ncbi:L-threonine 3-dehydrogenase [Streptomyces sp. NPDC088261]|uniref:L-threonine 3-dehydrogenase n=1 Tax=Streptomyces sp. NPDC088261 TaxID=3365851 RepID=UPI003809BA55
MKALVKTGPGGGLEYLDVPVPVPGRHDVLIKVLRTGICGTDLHIYDGTPWARRTVETPRIIGHEFVGEIVRTGSGVGGLPPGQLVSAEGHLTCGTCVNCRADRKHLCLDTRGLGVRYDGAFAEYVVLPAENVWVHREGVSLDVAAMFDAFGNAVHVADSFPVRDRTVLVTGAGPIGAMAAAVAVHRGARLVAVSDVNPSRLDIARRAGAHLLIEAGGADGTFDAAAPGLEDGFDIGFEMSGSPSALHDLLGAMAPGGRIAFLGLPDRDVPTDWADISMRMLTIQGVSGRRVFDTWHTMAGLLDEGFDPSFVVTDHFDAAEYEKGFATAAEGRGSKVLLDWAAPGTADPVSAPAPACAPAPVPAPEPDRAPGE